MKSFDFSHVIFPKKLLVIEQELDITSLPKEKALAYVALFKELVYLYQTKQQSRFIVGMAGPAGSGKSFISAIFKEIAKQTSLPFRVETLGIDGFHYLNEFLLSHFSGGEALKNHKGRFNTYDVEKLTVLLKQFSDGGEVSFPEYSRKTHDPVEDAIVIKKDEPVLLIVEGLWVLYEKFGWEKVGELLDFSIFVNADNEKVKQGVVDRHVRGGRTVEDAHQYYEANEAKNFDLVMQTKNRADKIIPAYYEV